MCYNSYCRFQRVDGECGLPSGTPCPQPRDYWQQEIKAHKRSIAESKKEIRNYRKLLVVDYFDSLFRSFYYNKIDRAMMLLLDSLKRKSNA